MSKKKLENLRDQVNDLDNQILDILDRRSYVVKKIGKLKDISKGVVDENRENQVLKRLTESSKGEYSKDSIIRIWRELFDASSRIQLNSKSNLKTKRSIDGIKVYKGGKSNIEGFDEVIKLSSNENSFGPSENIFDSLTYDNINRYPEINGVSLRKKLAKINNIESDQIILGCGSDETLLFAALSFCQFGDEIIHAEHGFEMYSIIAKVIGAVSKLAIEKDYKVSVQSICNQLTPATKLIYIANPNNPTGTYLTKNEIRELMIKIPKNVVLVLDCAYAEYVEQKNYDLDFSLVKEYDNIIITRTFSKAYGLAAIRLGWCYSSPKIASILNRVKGPFNTNAYSQKIAINALNDQKYLNIVIKKNKEIKKWFENELIKLDLKVYPSFANFSFIESTNEIAEKISIKLEKKGIIIRQLHSYNLPHCLRITIGKMEEMQKIIEILKKIL